MDLGSLLGNSSSGGGSFGVGTNPKSIIRNKDFKGKELKDRVRNTSPIKAWHEEKIKRDGRMKTKVVRDVITRTKVEHISRDGGKRIIDRDYDDNVLKVVQGSVKSGQTVSSWKNNFSKKNRLESVGKNGVKTVYHIGGDAMNREKRKELSEIFDSQGPTKKELEFKAKKEARLKKINVFQTNRDRDESDKLENNRRDPRAAMKKNVENSSRLGIAGKEYKSTSDGKTQSTNDYRGGGQTSEVLSEKYVGQSKGSDATFSQREEGAASVAGGIGAKPQEDDATEENFNEDQKPLDNNIMP